MATYYWVGSSGNWSDAANHWSNSSGGSPSASYLPTATDDVVFDANSNTGTGAFTVTVDGTSVSPSLCQNFSTGGAGGALDGAMTLTMGATAVLGVYGSLTCPATNFSTSITGGAEIQFLSTTTGKTITTNGVVFTNILFRFSGIGGAWTLGSALTVSLIYTHSGTFDTGNYNITTSAFQRSSNIGATTVNLGSSSITCSGATTINFTNTTNFTFNAGTSTITCSGVSPTFNGGGLTYYNVTFSSAGSGTATINGANTFSNNLTFTSRSATGVRSIVFTANQTVNGTLTLGAANTSVRRINVYGTASIGTGVGTAITLTVATLATLADVDFRDITAAGASGTWSGTRIGNGGGNSNITFTAGGPKYWNLAAGGNWSATAWATSSGGAVNANNFPLAQDTVYIVNTGLTAGNTITIDTGWWLPTIDASARTTAFTLASGAQTPVFFGNYTIPSVATVTGTGTWYFAANNSTQNITTNGVSVAFALNCNGSTNNTVKLLDNFTTTGAVTFQQGTLDLNSKTLTGLTFTSNNSITRTIAFGTGNITVTGNNATVWSCATLTNFSYTGTPTVNFNYSGSTGTRTIQNGSTGGTETNAVSMNVTAGSDTVTLPTTGVVKNFSSVGFTGLSNLFGFYYGNLTLGSGSTQSPGTTSGTFAATSGTQTITSNGVTIDRPVTINAPGAIVQCQDALTLGSTRTLTVTAGTFDANNKNVTTGLFASSGSTTRTITMGSGTWTISGTGTAWDTTTTTNLTFNANTSSLVFTGSSSTITFQGGGLTYYNVTTPGGLYRFSIGGANTYNNLTFSNTTAGEKTANFPSSLTQTVNGTFSATGSNGNCRIIVFSGTLGTAATISAASVSLSDIDFRDITAAGASISWTGTRLGDCGGNTNITFTAPKTVYWNLVGGGDWTATAWAATSGGVPATTNQPLPQDTAIFDNTGINAGSVVTFDGPIQTGAWNCSVLTNAVTFNFTQTYGSPSFYGNVTLGSGVTTTAATTSALAFGKRGGLQLITSNGVSWGISVGFSGTQVQLADNLTTSQNANLNYGQLDLNNNVLTCAIFAGSNTVVRSIAFGTGSIGVTGSGTTVWSCADLTNFSYTGTPTVNFTYSGSTGTRTIANGNTAGATESNVVDVNVTAGSDTISFSTPGSVRNLTYTGFSGLGTIVSSGFIYGNLTLSPTQTSGSSIGTTTFAATSGTKTITSNGVVIDRPIVFQGIGGTWSLQDALTLGSTRALGLFAGTLNTNGYSVSCGRFNASDAGATGNRTLNLGASSFTCVGISTSTMSWQVESTTYTFTLDAGTSTIYLAEPYTGASTQDFLGGGKAYYNLVYTQGEPSTITGNNTFNNISNTFQPITVKFAAGSTQTVANFSLSGTSGNLVTLASDTPGSQWYLSKSNGSNVNVSYCSITDSNVSPAGYWYARTVNGNVNGGNNTGWVFSGNVPVGNGFLMFLS